MLDLDLILSQEKYHLFEIKLNLKLKQFFIDNV
jgi:hypothetical protein